MKVKVRMEYSVVVSITFTLSVHEPHSLDSNPIQYIHPISPIKDMYVEETV